MQSMASQSILISKLFTCNQPFSAPYPHIFPKLLLPRSSRFPFNTFGSFPKHSIISLAQFPNALPLHPIPFPIPVLSPYSVQKVLQHWLTVMGVTPGHWGFPKTALAGVHTGSPFLWVRNLGSCLPLGSSGTVEMGSWWADGSWDGSWSSWGRVFSGLSPPAIASLCSFVSADDFLSYNLTVIPKKKGLICSPFLLKA